MKSSRNAVALATLLVASAALLASSSAQAACNGGACPITGGSLRTQVGAGFVIPQLTIFASQSGPANGQPMTFGNTAMGFVLPTPNAQVTVGGASAPYSIMMQIGQLTYGSADPLTADNLFEMGARWSTPALVQVPLFPAPSQALFGVSTNIGQSFPGDVRTYMTRLTATATPSSFMTTIGGPATFSAGGRPGAAVVNTCAGAIVPDPIPATWMGGCNGEVPLTTNQINEGVAIVPVTVRYTATANQFGGVASQRQVKRTSQAGVPPIANNWLGRIRFNRFFPAPYTVVQMQDTVNPKTYPTLEQGLVEPVVWGANFGQIVRRVGAIVPPGDLVSGRVTPAGRPVNITTQVVAPGGTGMGAGAQTSTSWGGPLTTGMVTVNAFNPGISSTMWTNTGADQRTPNGQGQVSMVSGGISARLSPPPVGIQGGTERTMLTLKLPEPAMGFGLAAGIAGLAGLARSRRRA